MRILAIALVAAGSLGVMALGGGAITADRVPRASHSAWSDSALTTRPAPVEGRVWYGGTLPPIVVQANAPAGKVAHKPACPPAKAN